MNYSEKDQIVTLNRDALEKSPVNVVTGEKVPANIALDKYGYVIVAVTK